MSDLDKLQIIDPEKVTPIEYRILLMVGKVEEKSKGGIILSAKTAEKEQFADIVATYVCGGELAFSKDNGELLSVIPKKGDRVIIAKYSGLPARDKEGNLYRFANDKDIVAIY